MAKILDIRFDSVGKQSGVICDRCGAYIQNIYTVKYDTGLIVHYGIECFKKLQLASNLTDAGMKLLKKILKKVKEAYEFKAIWDSVVDIEDARNKKAPFLSVFETYEAWKGHSFEEFKRYCTSEEEGFFAHDIKAANKELQRFKHLNIDIEKFNNI